MKKNFVTLFPKATNIDLIKDNGQLPFKMHKLFGYNSTLVCYNNDSYTYKYNEVKDLNLHFLKKSGKTFFLENSILAYLCQNAKKIDVLNLYFLTKANMIYGLLYKWLNPNGILYLKLDLPFNNHLNDEGIFEFTSPSMIKEKLYKKIFKKFVRKADIVSVETQRFYKKIKKGSLNGKLMYLPNGIDRNFIIKQRKRLKPLQIKENMILTVGRIGAPVKNHELMLKALPNIMLDNWKVIFVGPIHESFQAKIDNFYQNCPHHKKNIFFVGNITDREKLYGYYARSKIFCMTSLSESFCISMLEALSMGSYLVGTDTIPSMEDFILDEQFGKIIPSNNPDALQSTLQKVMQPKFYNDKLGSRIMDHADYFFWRNHLSRLEKKIEQST